MLEVIFTKDKPENDIVKVIAMFEDKPSKVDFLNEDEASLVQTAIAQADFEAKSGDYINVYGGTSKIVLLGVGKNDDDLNIQSVGEKIFNILYNEEKVLCTTAYTQQTLSLHYHIKVIPSLSTS